MTHALTDEQQLLEDSARRWARSRYDLALRRAILHGDEQASAAAYHELAELGLLGVLAPEEAGGIGGGPAEAGLIARVLGECLCLEPVLATLVATRALARLAPDDLAAAQLGPLIAGDTVIVPILPVMDQTALRIDGAGALVGEAPAVLDAPRADAFLVAAEALDGEQRLHLVAAQGPAVSQRRYRTVDGRLAADVTFGGCAASIGFGDRAAIAGLADLALYLMAAETLGVLDRTLALTVDYTRTREQFGGPIARFQVLQHRMVDLSIAIEELRSLVTHAGDVVEGDDVAARLTALSALRVRLDETARSVGEEAVQLHGGMGVTEEMEVSHHFRRLVAARLQHGTVDQHLRRYARHRRDD